MEEWNSTLHSHWSAVVYGARTLQHCTHKRAFTKLLCQTMHKRTHTNANAVCIVHGKYKRLENHLHTYLK